MATTDKRITKKIENSYVVWFEESNRWIQFEEPAYFIYNLNSENIDIQEIIIKCQKRYGLSEKKCNNFVSEIISTIKDFSTLEKQPVSDNDKLKIPVGSKFNTFKKHTYLIKGHIVEIDFETSLLGYYIHPVLAHLEIKNSNTPDIKFEIFNYENRLVLRNKNVSLSHFAAEDINQLKRKLYVNISNFIYNKQENDWMTFIHASAITDGDSSILLSSSSGGGKSTLAALLIDQGLQFVSDDFVAVAGKRAYPFPAAISVKEGSFSLFPENKLIELNYHGLKNSSVRFIYPDLSRKYWYNAKPVEKIVFVRYNPQSTLKFKELTVLSALGRYYEEARVTAKHENARKFIDWFSKLKCYELEYSENTDAVNCIRKLFKNI